ncbi:MAG TPA: hypothetical protein VKY74_05455 [Chloroflexia bacterium]|nr:hypothetical protein [Chloroflexia bacterium]
MTTTPFPQAVIESLLAHSRQIAEDAARRMCAALPYYAGLPQDRLIAQNQRTVEQIAQMMEESNFSVARDYFEKLTESRERAGISVEDFLRATEYMMSAVTDHVERVFAADPTYRDRALHVLQAGVVFTRTLIGRQHLHGLVEKTRIPLPEKPPTGG